jgi:hypothetical protein
MNNETNNEVIATATINTVNSVVEATLVAYEADKYGVFDVTFTTTVKDGEMTKDDWFEVDTYFEKYVTTELEAGRLQPTE